MRKVSKGLLTCFLALVMSVCFMAMASAYDEVYTENGFKYTVNNGEATVKGHENPTGDLVIPDTLGGYSVTNIGYEAFRGCTGITSITIPGSVTEIGGSAFDGCTGLTNVTIPNSVTKIDWYAFRGCTGLTRINWNAKKFSCTYNDESAFANAGSATNGLEVIFGESVERIPYYALGGLKNLTSITIGENVTEIDGSAFIGCTGLTNVTIPDSVTKIGWDAFRGCTGLTSLTIGENVTDIGNEAFSGCTGLTNVTIPDSVTDIGEAAFENCTGLTNVTIPDSVTDIGGSAFAGCTGLSEVTIGRNVKNMGSGAFSGCSNLASANIDCQNIGTATFKDCTSLKTVKLGSGAKMIGTGAFRNCTGLTNLEIADDVKGMCLDDYSFYNCPLIKSVIVPKGVAFIEKYALGYADNYEKIDGFEITGYSKSTAERYATENGFGFNLIGGSESHEHNYVAQTTKEATCTSSGIITYTCSCGSTYFETVDMLPHADADNDGKCDTCGKDLGTNTPTDPVQPDKECDCICHKGGFAGFVYKIILMFWKLFGVNKTCSCGVVHY